MQREWFSVEQGFKLIEGLGSSHLVRQATPKLRGSDRESSIASIFLPRILGCPRAALTVDHLRGHSGNISPI